jgi:hypothetical protein
MLVQSSSRLSGFDWQGQLYCFSHDEQNYRQLDNDQQRWVAADSRFMALPAAPDTLVAVQVATEGLRLLRQTVDAFSLDCCRDSRLENRFESVVTDQPAGWQLRSYPCQPTGGLTLRPQATVAVKSDHFVLTSSDGNGCDGLARLSLADHGETAGQWRYTAEPQQDENTPLTLPQKLSEISLCSDHQYIYCLGGVDENGGLQQKLYQYHTVQNKWWLLSDLPQPLKAASVAVCDHFLYLMGGQSDDEAAIVDVQRLNLDTLQWQVLTPLSGPRKNAAVVLYQGSLVLLGGEDANGNVLDTVETYLL